MAKVKPPRRKHVPVRTCIACRQSQGKRELVRIVRTPGAGVQVDLTGKLPGRGAYICRAQACWEEALSGSRLATALKTVLTAEDMAALRTFAAAIP